MGCVSKTLEGFFFFFFAYAVSLNDAITSISFSFVILLFIFRLLELSNGFHLNMAYSIITVMEYQRVLFKTIIRVHSGKFGR